MGLDNYPQPYPCEILGIAKYSYSGLKERLIRLYEIITRKQSSKLIIGCEKVNCPFRDVNVIRGMLGTHCWLRGKVYDWLVRYATGNEYTLYEPQTPDDLMYILNCLKGLKIDKKSDEELMKMFPERFEDLEHIRVTPDFEEWRKHIDNLEEYLEEYNRQFTVEDKRKMVLEEIREDYKALVSYLKTLLSINEWVNHPDAVLEAWW